MKKYKVETVVGMYAENLDPRLAPFPVVVYGHYEDDVYTGRPCFHIDKIMHKMGSELPKRERWIDDYEYGALTSRCQSAKKELLPI